jgi:hypothetical protein
MVIVRGCYTEGLELSELMGCPSKGSLKERRVECFPKDQRAQPARRIWVEQYPSYLSHTELVFNYREAQDLQAWERLRIGEVVLFGQFETTDWRDEPTDGEFGQGDYSDELILADVLN